MNRQRFIPLLLSMVALILIDPLLEVQIFGIHTDRVLFTIVLLAGLYGIGGEHRIAIRALVLLLPALVADWVQSVLGASAILVAVSFTFTFLFIFYVVWVIAEAIRHESRVSVDTIAGGISIYLLLGLLWTVLYAALETLRPGSFEWDGVSLTELKTTHGVTGLPHLMYFSFTTLTTLGFGDITPETRGAQALTTLQALVGQLFLAIFIAALVGMHLAGRRDPD